MQFQRLPLVALRAFEAAGRTGSFRAAAAELALTPSAISHAIHKLEDLLGTSLFERSGRYVVLTADGETLKRHIGNAFDELRRGMEIVSARGSSLLRLHCAPSFAAQWLTIRLSRFHAEYPEVEVRLAAGTDYARFLNDEFDADIAYGLPRQGGLLAFPLVEECVAPLCTPKLAESIRKPADLLNHVLIESDAKKVRWSDWFKANGLIAPPPHGMRFDRSFLAIAAAVEGLGVTLESTLLAERELAAGKLVRPLDGIAADVRYTGHFLVFPRSNGQRRALRKFMAWLERELGVTFPVDETSKHG